MKQRQHMQAELKRLRRENERLRRQLTKLEQRTALSANTRRSDKSAPQTEQDNAQRLAEQALRSYRMFQKSSYARYVWSGFRNTGFYQRIRDIWVKFKRYRLISRCLSIAASIFAIMGTSAAVLLIAVICLLFVPAALLLAGGTTLLGLFRRKQQNARFRAEIEGKTVYLCFPAELSRKSFTAGMLRELAARPQSAVFVVSPHAWSTRGLGGQGFYVNARREGAHLFLLRRHYFFFFRHLLDEPNVKRTVVIL